MPRCCITVLYGSFRSLSVRHYLSPLASQGIGEGGPHIRAWRNLQIHLLNRYLLSIGYCARYWSWKDEYDRCCSHPHGTSRPARETDMKYILYFLYSKIQILFSSYFNFSKIRNFLQLCIFNVVVFPPFFPAQFESAFYNLWWCESGKYSGSITTVTIRKNMGCNEHYFKQVLIFSFLDSRWLVLKCCVHKNHMGVHWTCRYWYLERSGIRLGVWVEEIVQVHKASMQF